MGCVGNRIDRRLVIVKVGGWAQGTQCIVLWYIVKILHNEDCFNEQLFYKCNMNAELEQAGVI